MLGLANDLSRTNFAIISSDGAGKGSETLDERVGLLDLPRQLSLIDFLAARPQTFLLAGALRAKMAVR